MKIKKLLTTLGIIALCSNFYAQNKPSSTRREFIETKNIDNSIKPGNDFYDYANGNWLKTAKIPSNSNGAGSSKEVDLTTQDRLKNILQNVAENDNNTGSIQQKVGDYYASGMDSVTINKRGYEPVKLLLAKIQNINSIPSLINYVAEEEKNGTESILGFSLEPDQKNSTENIIWAVQSGIGLPERDYYFRTDKPTLAIQNAYKNYIANLFKLTGSDAATATNNAETVYNIEKDLAFSHKTAVELRDVEANYNKVSLDKIKKEQPNISWNKIFDELGVKVESADMEQPAYYAKLNEMLQSVPLSNWKLYLKAHTLNSYANLLSQSFQDANFIYIKNLTGQKVQRKRADLMAINADAELGDALGQLYVEKYFTAEAKKRIDELVTNLTTAFANRIQHLDWMSEATKKTAEEKLSAIRRKIGYPEKWRDYSKVNIDKTKFFENSVSCNRNNFDYLLSQLGKPVDKNRWEMTAPTVDAYYNPYGNDINFPAGILQYPLFDKDADDAVNYGAIGVIIGHEMTHGFDDQGSQYDKVGNINDWWTKDDKTKFNQKVVQIQKLYDTFPVFSDLNINGKLTTGENMADFGGISIAYAAFKMTKEGQSNIKIDGFTPDQRFFLSFANIWRAKFTDQSIRQKVQTDPHSTRKWRVNGPLMNFTPFYKAFDVKHGEKMYNDEKNRIKIW
jgi:putative endopeptidase